jgi:RNA polymerase sigma-70 factor (ECF subfamily)
VASDVELVDAWRTGDRSAGEALFERHYDAVARFFQNKVGEAASDLIQRTFLACCEGSNRFRGDTNFRSYLFAIAYRLMCKHFDEQRRDRLDFDSVSAHDLSPGATEVVAQRQEQRLVLEALRRIPLEHQVLLELHYWEQMTAAEAAAVLGIPLGTAKTRLRRARELLEARLAELASSPELLASTVANLEAWAQAIRDQLHAKGR